ncbi:DNA-binding domain-containing protein [Bdellovibrio sp. BCCA]|uniref:DNA-binding domain-containing protein n=1 Tax=Bdellovibrio sp. BCCA TaxID=3136281 RepID=UPI0030EFCA5B
MNLNEALNLFKRNIASGQVSDGKAEAELKPVGSLSLEQAFQVYHQGYVARLTGALREIYEASSWVLGEDEFHNASRKYINAQPSRSYNLSDYGHEFPEHLQMSSLGTAHPFLYDLARFEWTFKNMYHTPTSDPFPAEEIQALLNSEDFKVHFIEGMDIFQSPYAIYEIWRRRNDPSGTIQDIHWQTPESLLVYKKQKKIYVHKIDHVEAQVLTELKEGKSVSQALVGFSHVLTSEKITQLFQIIMRAGIIEDVLVLET